MEKGAFIKYFIHKKYYECLLFLATLKLSVICVKKIQLKNSEQNISLNPMVISGVKQLIIDNRNLFRLENKPIFPALKVGTFYILYRILPLIIITFIKSSFI